MRLCPQVRSWAASWALVDDIVASMFDLAGLPAEAEVSALDTAALVDAIGAAARLESAVMARRLVAVAELFERRLAERDVAEREDWLIDGHAEVTAEVAAALGISRGRAAGVIRVATALRDRLPEVAAVFGQGRVDYRVVSAIVSRTDLIIDPAEVRRVDVVLGRQVGRWNRLSKAKINDLIDRIVVTVDRLAKKPLRGPDDKRDVGIGPDHHGMAELWGTVRAEDGLAFDARLDYLAGTVCAADPRTSKQRRADATGAMAVGADRLACRCGRTDCPAGADSPAQPQVVITVLTDEAGASGYIPGFGVLDEAGLGALAGNTRTRFLAHPGQAAPEPRYRPSAALAEFVRARDLTCRFPGCDVPASRCDIDHTVPWPHGPTHPSNLKLTCRVHHLLKTFWSGPRWWTDRQLPDGTVIWTAPTGHEYATKPAGALFFPMLAKSTGELSPPAAAPAETRGRTLMMPTRALTRVRERQARIDYERGINAALLAAQPPPEPEPPPPF